MEQMKRDFNDYESREQQSFEEYRNHLNAKFAEYMCHTWPEYKSKPAEPVPDSPEPPRPAIKDPDTPPSNDPIPFDEVKPAPKPIEPPQPVVPLSKQKSQPVEPNKPVLLETPRCNFTFYGTPYAISLTAAHRFKLFGIDENSVADAWLQLSSDKYGSVIADCLEWRDKQHLPNWDMCVLSKR